MEAGGKTPSPSEAMSPCSGTVRTAVPQCLSSTFTPARTNLLLHTPRPAAGVRGLWQQLHRSWRRRVLPGQQPFQNVQTKSDLVGL